jgi:hypothetical protein
VLDPSRHAHFNSLLFVCLFLHIAYGRFATMVYLHFSSTAMESEGVYRVINGDGPAKEKCMTCGMKGHSQRWAGATAGHILLFFVDKLMPSAESHGAMARCNLQADVCGVDNR